MANSFVRYTGNGSTTAYAVPFSYVSQTHVAITISGVANTAFTWNGAGTEITFDSAPADESNIEIRRTTSQTVRLVDYTSGSVLTETDLDTDSTQAFYMGQEAVDDANDVIKTSSSTFQWDGSSKRITNVTDPTGAQDAATKNYTDTAGTSQVTLATTQATNAATSATAAATSATGAATSATNAATSATNAATSATTATTKATAAATSATNSATSATTSTTQATTATTQASAASTSATNAATSATAAAASADSFDDTYLGAKSSAPTVDNDGDALTTGDLYFNTTNNKMYFRTSSAWESFTTVTTALTVADESSDATCFPLFVTAATGDLPPKSGSNLAFNSSSGLLTATGFSGALTGNVTGNASGSSGSTTGNAATATALASARTIGGVSFDGTGNISLPGVNTGGNQDTSGTAADATVLETARTIGGVSFNGSGNIDLPGVNTAGNQATSGLAATTTALASARTIGGVSFDGTGNIDLPGVNTSGNQNTSGTAAGLSATLVTGSGGTGLTGAVVGKQTIWIPAAAMYPNTTAGCAALAQVELSNGPEIKCLDFDTSSDENAQFTIAFPKLWNEGTVTFQAFWTVTGTNTGTVAWGLSAVAFADNGDQNTAFGTNVVATAKAFSGTTQDLTVSAESGAVTIAGSPSVDELCYFQIMRDISADDQSGDARLLGIKLFFTTDALTDA